MSIRRIDYDWHEFFPYGIYMLLLPPFIVSQFSFQFYAKDSLVNAAKHNYGAVVSLWAPVILVCVTISFLCLVGYFVTFFSLWGINNSYIVVR